MAISPIAAAVMSSLLLSTLSVHANDLVNYDNTGKAFEANKGNQYDLIDNRGVVSSFLSEADAMDVVNSGFVKGNMKIGGNVTNSVRNEGTVAGSLYFNTNAKISINKGDVAGNVSFGGSEITINEGHIYGWMQSSGTDLLQLDGNARVDGGINNVHGGVRVNTDYKAGMAGTGTASHSEFLEVTDKGILTILEGTGWATGEQTPGATRRVTDITNAGEIRLQNNAELVGGVTNNGLFLAEGRAKIFGGLLNAGRVEVNSAGGAYGNTLTVDGDYQGVKGSSVTLHGSLADDNSPIDRLLIKGDASGESSLHIINENGSGASTLEGIKVVQVDGASNADFKLDGRVVAGAYDYSLQKGNATDDKSWFLTSYLSPSPQAEPEHKVRPESASYTANLQAARTLFDLSSAERSGAQRAGKMWMLAQGGHNRFSMKDGQNKTTANRGTVQLGSDMFQWSTANGGNVVVGVMAGYGHQKSKTENALTGKHSSGNVNGYSAGLYSTWYQDALDHAGLYADSWLEYGWFNNEVKGDDLSPEKYKSKSLKGSLEMGYNWQVAQWGGNSMDGMLWLQPHAQVIWSDIKQSEHAENNGTRVNVAGRSNVQTRLGMTSAITFTDKDRRDLSVTPFIEANWLHNSDEAGVKMNDSLQSIAGAGNIAEARAGVKGTLTRDLSLSVSAGQQFGSDNFRDTTGSLGVTYKF